MASTSSSTPTASANSAGPSRKYVPPALRSKPASSPSRANFRSGSFGAPSSNKSTPTPIRTTPYQRAIDDVSGPSRHGYPQPSPWSQQQNSRNNTHITGTRNLAESVCTRGAPRSNYSYPSSAPTTYIPPSQRYCVPPQSHSAPSPRRRHNPETAHLFLAGDSFVGALSPAKGPQPRELPLERGDTDVEREEYSVVKKQWEEYDAIPKMIKIRKEKGAAAKGLNNPMSKKNIAPKILDHGLNAFGDIYHDYNKTPRFFMMMFGNVDLNINYLWQLVNREINSSSFTPEELASAGSSLSDFNTLYTSNKIITDAASADHTENEVSGKALGPTLFVRKVVREYTTFIEREIVNGPVGHKLRQFHEAANDVHARGIGPSKNRVLVAGALPPMVHDRYLYRILGKYVDQHVEAKSEDRDNGKKGNGGSGSSPESPLSSTRSTNTNTDSTLSSTSRSTTNDLFDKVADLTNSVSTLLTIPDPDFDGEDVEELEQESKSKEIFQTLLSLNPSPCTLSVRAGMIKDFNFQLSIFCAKYPDILQFVTINDLMSDAHPRSTTEEEGNDLAILEYYCSQVQGDGANVHPTWERTYPLWLDVLKGVGVDVDSFPDVDLEGTEAAWTAEKGARLERSKYKT